MMAECGFEELYAWVDNIPITRRKKNISRDFSDAVFAAEILKFYFPRWVDLHNYSTVNSKSAKVKNWETLNTKVLKKLKIPINDGMISGLASATPGAAEEFLQIIKEKVESADKSRSDSMSSLVKTRDESVPSYEEICKALNECHQELTEKEEVISTLKGDVQHLRSLLKLKEQYIVDLTSQLKRAKEKSINDNLSFT